MVVPPQLAFDVLGDAALLTRDINLEAMRSRRVVTAIAAISEDAIKRCGDQPLNLGDDDAERVAILWLPGKVLASRTPSCWLARVHTQNKNLRPIRGQPPALASCRSPGHIGQTCFEHRSPWWVRFTSKPWSRKEVLELARAAVAEQ
jgi:hypothetical protein